MARYFGLVENEPSQESERLVSTALRRLSDEWIVLHSVSWQGVRNGRQADGEADFLLLHPTRGLIVIEVKGGGIELSDGRWLSKDRHGAVHSIKDPFQQAKDSKYALLAWLKERDLGDHLRLGHAVVFPNLTHLPDLGPAASREIALCATDMGDIERAVGRLVHHWDLRGNLSAQDIKRLIGALAPTTTVRQKIGLQSAAADGELLKLTADQVQAFAGLRASRGGLVRGGAGTGKTVLAIARAHQLEADGFRTLLVCYNELLGRVLADSCQASTSLTAGTFHALCFEQARKAGMPIPTSPSALWWEREAPQLLIDACAHNHTEFDAIVVDEGQDFAPDWIASLRCILAPKQDSPLYVFADPHQDIFGRTWRGATEEWHFTYDLVQNLRNTVPIAARVGAVFGTSNLGRGVDGPSPVWRVCEPKRAEAEVISSLEHLLDQGFDGSRVVVTCSSSQLVAKLRERIVGPYSLGKWGGRGIAVETISRFKGLDAEAIILVLDQDESELSRALAYVGISRARTMLVVIGSSARKAAVNWH